MKIWRLRDPRDFGFARAGRRGTWKAGADGRQRRVPPLVIEWEPGSNVIGDFVWPGFSDDLVVTAAVGRELAEKYCGFELKPVEMIQEERLYRLKRKPRKPRVLLPYDGPGLFDVWVTRSVALDIERSSVVSNLEDDGRVSYTAVGVESYKSRYNKETGELDRFHFPRVAGKGFFVRKDNLDGFGIFHINEFVYWKFCTDATKDFIENRGYSNVGFLEYGNAV